MDTKITIPCIKHKCILLPACKFKQKIECLDLKEYIDNLQLSKPIWGTINQVLKNVCRVTAGEIFLYKKSVKKQHMNPDEYFKLTPNEYYKKGMRQITNRDTGVISLEYNKNPPRLIK